MLHPPFRTSFTTTDPDEGSARVAADYSDNRMRVRGEREHFRYEQTRADLGRVRIDTIENSLVTDYAFEPLNQVIVAHLQRHEMDIWTADGHRRLGTGDVALVARPDEKYASRLHGARIHAVGMDLELLANVGGTAAPGRLRLDTLGPKEAESWRRTVAYVEDLLTADDAVASSPLVLGEAARLLASTVLAAFAEPEAETAVAGGSMPAILRRAVAFCDANPHRDIGVADIAEACHASVRAVQLAFRRHLDTTPTAYLRRVRLDRVRAELVAGDPGRTTVSRVAARWGFADASRFSAQYRATYGELPSATLRRG